MNGIEKYRRPEMIFADLLKKFSQGELEHGQSFLLRAVVLAIDVEGGKLQGPQDSSINGVDLLGKKKSYPTVRGPKNPKNSVKAIVISDGMDSFYTEEQARIFWPLFSADQISLPVGPGEHIYVFFEDSHREHGLWISRVAGHDSANFQLGSEKLESLREGRAPRRLNSHFDRETSEPPQYRTDDSFSSNVSLKKKLSGFFPD